MVHDQTLQYTAREKLIRISLSIGAIAKVIQANQLHAEEHGTYFFDAETLQYLMYGVECLTNMLQNTADSSPPKAP